MQVDHGTASSTWGLIRRPKATTTPELGAGVDHVVDPVRHREAQLQGRRLHRARHEGAAPSPAAIGLADDEDDLVARRDQRPQRADGHLGRAQVGEPQGCRPT